MQSFYKADYYVLYSAYIIANNFIQFFFTLEMLSLRESILNPGLGLHANFGGGILEKNESRDCHYLQ